MSVIQKASLVLIPSGYKDSVLYSQVPNTTAGDFTFTRASSGTRVNSDGYIETASVLGNELVVNGDFASDTDWTKGTGVTIANGVATSDGSGSNYGNIVYQDTNVSFANKKVKINFDVLNYVSGKMRVSPGNSSVTSHVQANGSYEFIVDVGVGTDIIYFINYQTPFNGSIDNISVKEVARSNVPRLDYTDSSCPTLLLEGQRTNELKYSEDYSQSYWRKDKLTATANSATSPSGLTDAFLIQETTYTNSIPSFDLQNSNTLSAGTYTLSFYVKNNSGRYLGISFGSSGERVRTNFDFNTNTFKTLNLSGSTTGSASYTTLGDYYRISITATFPSSIAVDNVLMPLETDTYPFFAFQDSDNRSFYLWGMQVEEGSYATSYISTSGTIVTRVKDFFEADSLGSIIGQTEGCIFIDFVYLDGERFYIYDAANTANGFLIYRSGTGYNLQVTTSGGGWAIANFITGLTIGTRYKLAINYKLNDYKVYVNGSQIATSTSIGVPTTNKISSWGLYGTTDFKNKINQFMMFNQTLTDSELIELTGGTATTYNWIDNDSDEIITSDGDNLIFT